MGSHWVKEEHQKVTGKMSKHRNKQKTGSQDIPHAPPCVTINGTFLHAVSQTRRCLHT